MNDVVPDLRRRAQARIDLDAIRGNVGSLRSAAGSAEVMAVVKADGYGHGMVPVARAAVSAGASWLGVAVLEEALRLRAGGLGCRVFCWLAAPGEDFAAAIAVDVDLSASAPWAVDEIGAGARTAGRRARLHLKVDSGLGRGGAAPSEWAHLVEAAAKEQASGSIEVVGVWSHLACADEPQRPENAAQVEAFRSAIETAERAGLRPEVRHLANSAGTVGIPATHFDLVRPGIAVYGCSPSPAVADSAGFGLRPAMTLVARLAHVKRMPAGHGVSYGHTYVTSRQTTLGLVPLGYADGIPRAAGNHAPLWAAGARRRIAGRVCMDQFVVDLGDDPVCVGDEVVLFGTGESGEPTAQEWADATGTISYEIVTRIGERIPRVYLGKRMTDSDSTGLVRWAVRAGLVAGTAVATTAVRRGVARRAAARRAEFTEEIEEIAEDMVDAVALGSAHVKPTTVWTDDGVGLCVEVEPAPEQPNAPTLVFLPGFCLSMDAWHFQRLDLRGAVRCVFYDQRGHGRSGRGKPERSTLGQLVSDLREVIAATTPEGPVVLIGHSLGGMVVMSYAAAHPEDFGSRIVGAALIATSPGRLAEMTLGLPPAVVKNLWRFSPGVVDLVTNRPVFIARGLGADRDIGLWITRRLSFGRTDVDPAVARFAGEILNSTPLDVFGEFFAEFTRYEQEIALPVLRNVQALIVAGGKDVLTPVTHSRRMAAAIPEAELTVIPDAGHLVMLERPEEVDAALRRLLERVRMTTYRSAPFDEAARSVGP